MAKDLPETLLTVLNFSGGKQSSALLWMVLRGDIEVPENLVVLNADPGMENSSTYLYTRMMLDKCREAGIYAKTVEGPNLYEDLINLKNTTKRHIKNPPYFTKDPVTGKRGKLVQGCTGQYKIAPMDREIRRILHERYGIHPRSGNVGVNTVKKWIGFSFDEVHRIKPAHQKYVEFVYPLIDMGMRNADVIGYYLSNNLPIPSRSVCNACFANSISTLKEMHDERPEDWAQAVEVDEAVRDWSQLGVDREVFVSEHLIPLREMAERGFRLSDDDEEDAALKAEETACTSGYCFV